MVRHTQNPSLIRAALAIYIVCFSVGIMTHGRDFVIHYEAAHNWRPYRWGVIPLEVFWTVLIVLDALVVGLFLAGKRRSGLVAALTIMTLDVAANSYALFVMNINAFAGPLVIQMAFFGFVLGSITFLWPNPSAISDQ